MWKSVIGRCASLSVAALAAVACSSANETALEQARIDLDAAETAFAYDDANCYKQTVKYNQAYGEKSLGDWDEAAAENIDNISPSQEMAIRSSIGAEMGLAPSEVNGWKEIYRSRAERAKEQRALVENSIAIFEGYRDETCRPLDESRTNLAKAKMGVMRLEHAVKLEDEE